MAAIIIKHGDPSTGKLILSDNDHTYASRKEVITWIIGPDSGVKYISNIYPKTPLPPTPFFSQLPHRVGSSANWQAVIDAAAVDNTIYYYSISWMPDIPNSEIKEYDPIISIKPTDYSFIERILAVVAVVLSILSIALFFGGKEKKKSKKSY